MSGITFQIKLLGFHHFNNCHLNLQAVKPIKDLTDAERAAIRAAKFGGSAVAPPAAVVGSVEKKIERAKRFGLEITAEPTVGGKPSKIGAVPSANLVSIFVHLRIRL